MPAGFYPEYIKCRSKTLGTSDKAKLIVAELGYDEITASSFVDYMSGKYGISKSTLWYNLKKLKRLGILDFAERNEEYKLLALTDKGKLNLRQMSSNGIGRVAAVSSLQLPHRRVALF